MYRSGGSVCSSPQSLRELPLDLAVRTRLAVDLPHVLRITGKTAHVLQATLDGRPAEVEDSRDSLELSTTDAAKRRLQLEMCLDSEHVGNGSISRCSDGRCETAELEVRPLTFAGRPELGSASAAYRLTAEYQGENWNSDATLDLAVTKNFSVLARGEDGLRVIGLEEEAGTELNELAHVETERDDFYNDVKLELGRYALVASQKYGLVTLDLKDPEHPRILSTLTMLGTRANGHNLFLTGTRAYLARRGPHGGIAVMDTSDLGVPKLLADVKLSGCDDVHDLYVAGQTATVNCYDFGVLVVDLSDLGHPRVLERRAQAFSHSSWVTTSRGRELVLYSAEDFAGSIQIADLTRNRDLTPVADFAWGSGASIHNIVCVGARCFVSAYQEGWFELDVSDPEAPRARRGGSTWRGPGEFFFEGASGIAFDGERVYVADTERGLLVYEPSGPW